MRIDFTTLKRYNITREYFSLHIWFFFKKAQVLSLKSINTVTRPVSDKQIYSRHPLSPMPVISNFFFDPFSISSNFPYNYIRYLEPRYLELSLCRINILVPLALSSRYLKLCHLDVQFLKKIVRKLWDSIEFLSFCVHL